MSERKAARNADIFDSAIYRGMSTPRLSAIHGISYSTVKGVILDEARRRQIDTESIGEIRTKLGGRGYIRRSASA